jgi:AcrR family transcriptional regulator
MIYSTAQLMRPEGVSSTGVREVVAHANAPRGSERHYFPDGKEQLINEAVAWAGNFAASRVERLVAGMSRPTPSKLFASMVQHWIDEYRTQGFGGGAHWQQHHRLRRDNRLRPGRRPSRPGAVRWLTR